MVLELRPPHGAAWSDLAPLAPVFASYLLSFVYIAIYWNNHHHLLHMCPRIDAAIMWANMHLLFWLSLIPFATAWVGETGLAKAPVALYGAALLMPAIAYYILQSHVVRVSAAGGALAKALGGDIKVRISPLLYIAGSALAFVNTWAACAVFVGVAAIWLVPDRRIEAMSARGE
jgi:uncharacterized membrane protein